MIVTVLSPWPVDGETWTQDASAAALQLHSRAAVTLTFTRPPDAATLGAGVEKPVWHRTAPGAVSVLTLVPPHATARIVRTVEMSAMMRRRVTRREDA